jgi:hypothetical protein
MKMEWSLIYGGDRQPDIRDITDFIGEGAPLWTDLQAYLDGVYHAKPKMAYSRCSAQPGWNMKYQKSGKSLCTMYPMAGYFIALVVIGTAEEAETEAAVALGEFTPYIQTLYRSTAFSCGGHWLMIHVKDREVLEDVKKLIAIRVRPKY